MVDAPKDSSFADLAPVYEVFPGFRSSDFAAFEEPKRRNPDFNGERLIVKRKLAALGKPAAAALAAAGLDVAARTSLSHPYTYNAYRVESMWVYFGRDEAAKRRLKRKLGAELGTDVDPTYHGVILLVEIDERRVACGLKIHPAAWWDGQNLKARIQRPAAAGAAEPGGGAGAFARLLNALPAGFAMTLGDWRKRYEAGKLHEADVHNYFRYYTPGEHWLNLLHETPAEAAIAAGPGLADRAAALLAGLVPVHRFTAWSPENDHVLSGRS